MKRTTLVIAGLVFLPVVAQAECGWLLMTPPGGEAEVVRARPLRDWTQSSAHDSAAACERAKKSLYKSVLEAMNRVGVYKPEQQYNEAVRLAGARCLPVSQVPIR